MSNRPSCGVASRMLLSTICVKTASNCLAAACRVFWLLPARAWFLSASKPCVSSAKRCETSVCEESVAPDIR
ncbi:hypothetical protein D3C81_1325990 [compost metagenome]